MSDQPNWLPSLVLLEDYGGNWERYIDAVYEFFKADFVTDKPRFQGRRLGLKRHPLSEGKEATFWHMTQEGSVEADRMPDLRRCDRIRWPRPVIENNADDAIKIWLNSRRGETRICLWFEFGEYLVILADRGDYILPWTAYPVVRSHSKRKLQREYEEYLRSEGKKGCS